MSNRLRGVAATLEEAWRKHTGLLVLVFFNLIILAFLLLSPGRPYSQPYHDTIIGFFPPNVAIKSFVSNWTPSDFGRPASVNAGVLLVYALQVLTGSGYAAETTITFLPFAISGISCYVLLRRRRLTQSELLAISCAFAYEFNWYTFELFASQLVIFAYSSIPLILLFASNLFDDNRVNRGKDVVGLVLALIIGSLFWNIIILPGLLLFVLVPLFGSLISGGNLRERLIRTATGVLLLAVAGLLYLAISAPSAFLPLIQAFSAGSRGVVGHTFSVPSGAPFVVHLPTSISPFLLPLSPTLRLSYWFLGLFFPLAMAFGLVSRNAKSYHLIVSTCILFIVFLGLMWAIIWGGPEFAGAIASAYNSFVLLDVFNGPTVFFMALMPMFLLCAYAGVGALEAKLRGRSSSTRLVGTTLLFLLVMTPISSHNLQIAAMANYGKGMQLDADNYNMQLETLPKDLENLITTINEERQANGGFRVLWLPFDIYTRDMVTSSVDDFNPDINNSNLTTIYEDMLNTIIDNGSMAASKMAALGYRYVVILNQAPSVGPAQIAYTDAHVPLGIDGSPSVFYPLFKSNSNFPLLNQTEDYTLLLNKLDFSNTTKTLFSIESGSCKQSNHFNQSLDDFNGSTSRIDNVTGPPAYINDAFTLSVMNKGPSCILFSTQFEAFWTASLYYPNGTGIPLQHLEAYGWQNGFSMNRNGNFTVSVTYTHQNFQYALIALSIGGILTTSFVYYSGGFTAHVRKWGRARA